MSTKLGTKIALEQTGRTWQAELVQSLFRPTCAVVLLLLLAFNPASLLRAQPVLRDFITVRGDQLMEDGKPFRFISFNLPNLQLIEDNLPFAETNAWRLPDEFEIRDGLMAVRQMGGTVVRTYSLSVVRAAEPDMPGYVVGPGKFNETAFRELDLVLKIANEQGIRLIIPLVNNWKWQGGRGECAGFRGKAADAFWTDPQLVADFEETIRFVLTRTNTLTGVRYSDDPAVLCWETGNELSCPPAWTHEIAHFIKSLDHHHLVMDGVNGAHLRSASLAEPDVDIVTTHHYPGSRINQSFAELIRENWALAKGRKPYVVGEFGFVSTPQMEDAMKTIMDIGMSGGLLWSLRFRDRDGGFYWHSEPEGANLYKAFHWPGSATIGADYDETNLMATVRRYAFAIRGLTPPPIPVPAPPMLLPIADAAAISWQGSVGAASYVVERAPGADGPWTVAGADIDESFVQYRPLFDDEAASKGNWYYRVRAQNEAGVSEPSNVVGPVAVMQATLVDELADFSKVQTRQGNLKITMRDCRKAKEDAHRAAGNAGDALIYQLPTAIESFRVFAFFPRDLADPKFSISDDARSYHDVSADKSEYFGGAGDYGYWQPVLYQARNISGSAKLLKIELTGNTQIGRVEIVHALKQP
ncbi:MAG TPA: cellulase family glycosylhydrolase [Candidatus Nitrosopolaris sp.]|nr:cellulase family glycosylhydrolase [Candidatus Nitrosopolaris sp.]